jgi:hypothetical protein
MVWLEPDGKYYALGPARYNPKTGMWDHDTLGEFNTLQKARRCIEEYVSGKTV